MAPKDTPPEIINKLNTELNAALADPKVQEAPRGPRRHPDAVDACHRFRQADRRRDAKVADKVIKFAHIAAH